MARRSSGEGSISQRKDGRWQGALQLAGRRVTAYGKTRREVSAKLEALRGQAATAGTLPERHTVGELLAAWWATGRPRWAPSTAEGYARWRRLIEADLGARTPLARLSPARLQAVVLAQQSSPRSAQLVYHVLHSAFGLAERWGWLGSNPVRRVVRPAAPRKRRQWWTPAQCTAFLAATEAGRWGPLWATALGTGCRLGELLGLRWADVSWEQAVLHVERSGQYAEGTWREKAPKTPSGERTLPLSALALAALRRQRAQQAAWRLRAGADWQDNDLVFTSMEGRPLRRFDVARALRNTVRALGLPPATVHGLRHLAGSLALEGGAPLPQVSRHLGHADTGITARVYSHALENGRGVVHALDAALQRGASQG
jgi:integrase